MNLSAMSATVQTICPCPSVGPPYRGDNGHRTPDKTKENTMPVVAVKVTVGEPKDRAVIGYLPSEGWFCDVHGKRRCAHLRDALHWLAALDSTPRKDNR